MSLNQKLECRFLLNFHGLGKPPQELPAGEENYWVDPGLFMAVLDQVCGREDIQITIDDANESDYAIALPLLRERKLKAGFFLVAGRIDQKGFLSSQQIKILVCRGHGHRQSWHAAFSLGGHEPTAASGRIGDRPGHSPAGWRTCRLWRRPVPLAVMTVMSCKCFVNWVINGLIRVTAAWRPSRRVIQPQKYHPPQPPVGRDCEPDQCASGRGEKIMAGFQDCA